MTGSDFRTTNVQIYPNFQQKKQYFIDCVSFKNSLGKVSIFLESILKEKKNL